MTEEHARAMDLPNYPCPPNLAGIATHAGSWGWANPINLVAQDSDGYLWAKASERLSPARDTGLSVLATWTEGGLGLYIPKRAYGWILSRPVLSEPEWTPVAMVISEPPRYALDFNPT